MSSGATPYEVKSSFNNIIPQNTAMQLYFFYRAVIFLCPRDHGNCSRDKCHFCLLESCKSSAVLHNDLIVSETASVRK
jgi:hypothetical protein